MIAYVERPPSLPSHGPKGSMWTGSGAEGPLNLIIEVTGAEMNEKERVEADTIEDLWKRPVHLITALRAKGKEFGSVRAHEAAP